MSFLRTASQPAATPVYTGLQLQTSSSALPIPIVYGVNKVAPNILWNGNFNAANTSGKGSSGGKGGGGGKGNTPNSYSTAIILGLCEGPVSSISAVWDNSTITALASVSSMFAPSFINGATPQSIWSYLSTSFPSQALAYNGTALVVDFLVSLGSAATLDSYSFEIQAVLNGTGFNGYDADPALVIQDFLTNAQYGVGFPPASIDATTLLGSSGDASYQSYCKAAGLALSPALIAQEGANSVLARWLQLTNTAAVWSSGLLKFIPYGDASLTGPLYSGGAIGFGTSSASQSYSFTISPQTEIGSASFNPNLTPIYNLSDDDFVAMDGEDPVQVERSDPYAAPNMQILEISPRANYYDSTPITAFDQNAIELYGLRIGSTVTAHEICDAGIAQTAAQLILQRGLYIRNHFTFKLSFEYCLLEPMDLVTLTDANLGLLNAVVRITEIEEDDDGILTLTAEEFPAGIATAVAYPVQTQISSAIATNADPGPVNPPVIFEPPFALTGGSAQIWAAISGGVSGTANPNWGGANIWASLDNSSYTQIGRQIGAATQGVTTAAISAPLAANPDVTHVLAVNLAESDGALAGVSASAAQNAATLCILGNELLAFETATLTGTDAYTLSTLYRGLYGTVASAHAGGAPFARLDDAIFKFALPANYIGQTLYLKFQSFNIFGAGVADLATCAVYTFLPIGAGVSHPVAAQLATSVALDLGLVTQTPAAVAGDLGALIGAITDAIDLGTIA